MGTICAVIGTYVVLRGLAFIGDALAHAAFPGVVIAYMLKANIYLGAALFTVATALGIGFVSRRARTSYDTTIGILFAGAFALGVLLMSTIQGYTADLFSFLFGNILGMSTADLWVVGGLVAIVLLAVVLCYKELLLLSFDPVVAEAMGYPVHALNYLLLSLVAITIVVSIQAVGIVLVVALLVTPSATAYLLTERFFRMMVLGVLVSVLAAVVLGLYLVLLSERRVRSRHRPGQHRALLRDARIPATRREPRAALLISSRRPRRGRRLSGSPLADAPRARRPCATCRRSGPLAALRSLASGLKAHASRSTSSPPNFRTVRVSRSRCASCGAKAERGTVGRSSRDLRASSPAPGDPVPTVPAARQSPALPAATATRRACAFAFPDQRLERSQATSGYPGRRRPDR